MTDAEMEMLKNMGRDQHRLNGGKKLLVSPDAFHALELMLIQRMIQIDPNRTKTSGELYFRGMPVEICELLTGLEYGIIK